MDEAELQKLLDIIDGNGPWWFFRGWFHTYPDIPEKRPLYTMCCELERRGLIERSTDEPSHVVFAPIGYTGEMMHVIFLDAPR